MNTYKVTVTLDIEIDAFDPGDAKEAVHDFFGEGDLGSDISVIDFTIDKIDDL